MDKPRWYWPVQLGLLLLMLLCTALVIWGDDMGGLPIPSWVLSLISSSALILILIGMIKIDHSVQPHNRGTVVKILWFVFGAYCVVIFSFFISQLF
ncbi:MAG: hypothetical protein ISN29_09790 [Gammaproteobacteria bacterium AqS3]|nr:hypothetical protein [Gammaproteobacteria bacterium AqS3]